MAESPAQNDRSVERERMIAAQVARRGVTDARVLEAMRQVPRDGFPIDLQKPEREKEIRKGNKRRGQSDVGSI